MIRYWIFNIGRYNNSAIKALLFYLLGILLASQSFDQSVQLMQDSVHIFGDIENNDSYQALLDIQSSYFSTAKAVV